MDITRLGTTSIDSPHSVSSRSSLFILITALLFAALFWIMMVGSAQALDGINLSEPVEPPAEGECPLLTQIKYPFISCEKPAGDAPVVNHTWENSRRIPISSDFIEGNGYWGWELNIE